MAEFAFDWLGLKPAARFRETTLEAVVEVLLAEEWYPVDVQAAMTHDELQNLLRSRVSDAHRRWKPTWTHKLKGMSVGSLNVPTVQPRGEGTDLVNLMPAEADVESVVMRGLEWMPDRLRVPLQAPADPS